MEGSKIKEKICAILTHQSDLWDWDGHSSLVSDLLDAGDAITAEQIVTLLESILETQGGNERFKVDVAAMRAILKSVEATVQETQKSLSNSRHEMPPIRHIAS